MRNSFRLNVVKYIPFQWLLSIKGTDIIGTVHYPKNKTRKNKRKTLDKKDVKCAANHEYIRRVAQFALSRTNTGAPELYLWLLTYVRLISREELRSA